MDKTLLYHFKDDSISITVEAYFDEKESLVMEGYDIGKKVKEAWGDSDYEYSVTISNDELNKLYPLFGLAPGAKDELLLFLQQNYNTNSGFTDFTHLLQDHNIDFETFSWT
jgi:hypothetical protein